MDVKDPELTQKAKVEIKDLRDPAKKKSKMGVYLFFTILCIGLSFLLRAEFFDFAENVRPLLTSLLYASASSFGIMVLSLLIQGFIAKRSHGKATLYNLVKVVRLITFIVIVFVFISFLNSNWYTAAVSLGLISLLLGFALQTPIASLIGWIYIVLRKPFKIGDRIQVGSFTGDVVEINFFDTTLWEFSGDFITSDLPSGRLIRFPNSMVFQNQIYNYSWQKFPYIWNEIAFYITYNSDLDWVEKKIKEIALSELDPATKDHVKELRAVIAETPVDEVDIKDYPFVNFRINENNWVEAVLIYIVNPKHSSSLRSKIVKRAITELLSQPDKVSFAAEGG